MYAVVEYNDYRKEQHFNVKMVTGDLELAKKVAFNNAKKGIPVKDKDSYRITSNFEPERYLVPKNKVITSFSMIGVSEYKNKLKVASTYSTINAVIELEQNEVPAQEEVEEIDLNLLCNNYIGSGYEFEDEVEEDYLTTGYEVGYEVKDEEEGYEVPPLK